MNAKEIIALNNEKRMSLNEDNLTKYEDMLMYIRITSNKSEQQTEEILLELLDHLLAAQAEGKSAEDVFGDDLKVYCDEIIDVLPKEKNEKYGAIFRSYWINTSNYLFNLFWCFKLWIKFI